MVRFQTQKATVIITIIITITIELTLGGSSPYTSTDKTKIYKHKRNNTKTQYK